MWVSWIRLNVSYPKLHWTNYINIVHLSCHICHIGFYCGGMHFKYITKLFKFQKRAIRIVSNSSYLSHTKPLFEKFKTLTISDLYDKELGIFMYKYKKGMLPSSFDHVFTDLESVHNYDTRNKTNFRYDIHKIKYNFYQRVKIMELSAEVS